MISATMSSKSAGEALELVVFATGDAACPWIIIRPQVPKPSLQRRNRRFAKNDLRIRVTSFTGGFCRRIGAW
jgi:hypothetical protein